MNRLQAAVATFLLVAVASLLVIFAVARDLYASAVQGAGPDVQLGLLLGLLLFCGVVLTGAIRAWRWTFWLLLVAFLASLLAIPGVGLQLVGLLPGRPPVWYGLFRMAVAAVEFGLGLWMLTAYRHAGVWGRGR